MRRHVPWSAAARAFPDHRRNLGHRADPAAVFRGDIDVLAAATPDLDDDEVGTMKVVIGVATAATNDPVLAAALDELVLSQPRRMISVVLENAVARGEIPAHHDLALIADAALGLNVLRAITGRPIDRVFVRRVLEDVILPLATGPANH